MTVFLQTAYVLPGGHEPLTHARVAHAGNWFSGGTPTASSTATGYFEAGADNSLTYEKWKPSSLPATWELTFGSGRTPDYCCIAAHTLGSNGCTISVQYHDGSGWVSVISGKVVPDDGPIYCIFVGILATRWRVSVDSGSAAPTIGVIRFGKSMRFDRPTFSGHMPVGFGRQTILRSNISDTGEFLGRTRQRVQLATSFDWSNLSETWVRANWPDFQLAVETDPFFIAWRPGEYQDVGYCMVDQTPAPSYNGARTLMDVSMAVRAYG